MKIKKITIKNLNSLKGTWVIDLEDSCFKENKNQFVIYGETGSGKTTILDAISLACFGKTPRMEEIMSKLSNAEALNELMTRRTTVSEATVIYECRNGTFESSFKMRKTGGRADGNLKFEFTLVNLETGEPVCDTITNLKRIEEVTQQNTNLSYLQFTRSMILAQGKFDKFIGAKEEERAQIMEAISGTDYAAMGVRIAAKAKSVIKKFNEKKEDLGKIQILSEEEESTLVNEKKEKPQEIKNVQKLIGKNSENIQWLELLEKYEGELNKALEDREKFEEQKKEFQPVEKQLSDAEKAFSCNVPYTRWTEFVNAQKEDEKLFEESRKNLEENERIFLGLKEEVEKNSVSVEEKKAEEKIKTIEWKKARTLLQKIESQKEKVSDSEIRKNSAGEKLNKANEKENELITEIEKLQNEIQKGEIYLEEHKRDETLEKLLPVLKEKGKNIQADIESSEKLKNKIKELEKECEKLSESVESLKKDKENADSELKELIVSKYKIVSELLRTSIADGKACPVCGSQDHPLCKDSPKAKENIESLDTAEKIQKLSELIENLEKEITEKISLKDGTEKGLSEKKEEYSEVSRKIKKDVAEFNRALEPWKFQAVFVNGEKDDENTEQIFIDLENLSESYKAAKNSFQENENTLGLNQKELEGIKLEELKEDYVKAEKEFEECQKDLEELTAQLKIVSNNKYDNIFSLDEEEKNFREEKEKLEADLKESDEKAKKVEAVKTSLEGSIRILKEKIAKREGEIQIAEKELEEVLGVNGFSSKKEFEDCRIEEDEYKQLKETQELLKKADTETHTRIESAKKTLSSHKKDKPEDIGEGDTETLKEKYQKEKSSLEEKVSELSARLGEINTILETNEKEKEHGLKLREELKVMECEKEKWEKIQEMIGKQDGTKFQVFVQVLFFKNLIRKANKYFTGILPEYSLVQVPGKVDFRIHSNAFSEDKEDRECGNMSGGEKFIISLSFALGISELSSRSVSIDSLFLDEGFGTLSGNALIQSVAALKKLQSAGKTLGIITHVSEVIKEFDLKIEAKQIRGVSGYSELKGPGITRVED